MRHPLLELQKIFNPTKKAVAGKVVKTVGQEVHISTDKGIVVATKRDVTEYKTDDRVVLKGGELSGRLRDEAAIPVFFI